MELRRKRGVQTTIVVPIVDADGDPVPSPAGLAAHVMSWSDDTTPVTTVPAANAPVEVEPDTGIVSLVLTAAEMDVDYLYVFLTTTTPGAKTQHVLVNTASPAAVAALTQTERNAIASTILLRDWNLITDAVPDRCLLQAARFLRNRWRAAGVHLTVFQEDDETPAWTATISHRPGGAPVEGLDPL